MTGQNTEMNCEDYKQAIAADPTESFAGGSEHAAHCSDCRLLRDAYRSLDRRIGSALAVAVPPLVMPELPAIDRDIDDSFVDNKVAPIAARRRPTVPTWFGLAAGLALAAYFGLLTLRPDTTALPLADQVVAHLDHEAGSRIVTDVAVPERTLDSVVSKDSVELDGGIGLITYARSCIINGKSIPHLVIQGEKGPITLLLMPDEPVDKAITLEGKAINGVILPVGRGSVAIVGERDERLDDIGNRVVNSVRWKT